MAGHRLFVAVAALILNAVLPATGDRLFSVSVQDEFLRVVHPFTGQTLTKMRMTVAGGFVWKCNGLARHPATGDLWVVFTEVRAKVMSLGTVNIDTGVVTPVGTLSDRFANIAFDAAGVLYGVTGDGATTPESLFTIDLASAASTLVMSLGNGNDGEAIAYHPDEGALYHASGLGQPNVDEVFEKIDLVTNGISPIQLSGDNYDTVTTMVHYAGGNFLAVDGCKAIYVLSTGGAVRRLATLDHPAKGLAYVPATSGSYARPYGFGCAGPSGHVPILMGIDPPTPTQRGSLELANGPGGGVAFLTVGVGRQTFAFTAGCELQIAPLTSFVIGLPLAGVGPGRGRIAVGIVIPLNLRGDGYWQFGVADGGRLAVSNPLHWHIE